ncbi:DEAD/DEAH box helicase [Chthonobacter albigriseus]|uniref:DEAD/DEAH box helicase n=1 Tax=Chthonobacter albigriseus TaxID=1683161 RepID=UPI0015EF2D79|nr:DEAD/DEAH box helicase [Chthonobacter albigriseus]
MVEAVGFEAAEWAETLDGPTLLVAAGERRAEALSAMLGRLLPAAEILHLPRWDCLPFEPFPPAREIMGRRIAVLRRLPGAGPCILVASPDALMQRVPPRAVLSAAVRDLRVGEAVDLDDLQSFLERTGWLFDDRIDEPGEAALRGQVIDLFPADAEAPVRLEHQNGLITAIHRFDPQDQLTLGDLETVSIGPASEAIQAEGGERPADLEHRLAGIYQPAETVFDAFTGRTAWLDAGARERIATALEASGEETARYPGLRLPADEWADRFGRLTTVQLEGRGEPGPRFATRRDPTGGLRRHVEEMRAAGRTVVLTGLNGDLFRLARRLGEKVEPAEGLAAAMAAGKGALAAIEVDLDRGFSTDRLAVIAAADVLGSRARRRGSRDEIRALPGFDPDGSDLHVGDTVVHRDHGLGVLRGLETVEAAGSRTDVLRLEYAGGDTVMVPVVEIGRVWRYGSDPDAVSLDRAKGDAWTRRREAVEAAIAATASELAAKAKARAGTRAPTIAAGGAPYERFVARFPYPESPDQADAIEAVLTDLGSGRPMDRLVCGDVGYGKTEVALRAAAAVALDGRQVAVVAPTTVLARQHEETVRRRFAGLAVEVAALSRFTPAAEARRVRAGLADGSIRVVVGTHAVAGKGVAYADLALVVIDEEQRFGAADKAKFRALAEGCHVLQLTATPIPRTLQTALAGLQDLSVIATPPGPRRPIRTVVAAFDDLTVRDAFRREAARGGQSFLVCPRIEDIEPMVERLGRLAPELDLRILHARLKAEEIDAALIAFGRGEGDVLVATSIIESGLDMPQANTMVVWRADRFGLSQLHQLRGRVGRGRRRGTVYLATDPDAAIAEATMRRLETLASLDRLGAGFEIAARDLDQRGAGDLLGEEQAGHVKLIGAGLYRHLLSRALDAAAGRPVSPDLSPIVSLGEAGHIPADTVPEEDVRIGLYARLAAIGDPDEAEAIGEEFVDRFGPMPEPVAVLLAESRVAALARRTDVLRVDAGPQGIAITFPDARAAKEAADGARDAGLDGALKETRLIVPFASPVVGERAAETERILSILREGRDLARAAAGGGTAEKT